LPLIISPPPGVTSAYSCSLVCAQIIVYLTFSLTSCATLFLTNYPRILLLLNVSDILFVTYNICPITSIEILEIYIHYGSNYNIVINIITMLTSCAYVACPLGLVSHISKWNSIFYQLHSLHLWMKRWNSYNCHRLTHASMFTRNKTSS